MDVMAWLQSLNMLDWLVVVVLGAGALAGSRRGFILMFTGLTGFFIALGGAFLLTGRVVGILDGQWNLLERAREMLLERVPIMASVAEADLASVPVDELFERLRGLPLPDSYIDALRDAVYQAVPVAVSEGMLTFGEFLYYGMAAVLISVVTFVILFIVLRILVRIGGSLLHTGVSMTPFSPLNRLAGLALGTGHYALLLTLGLGVLTPFLALEAFRPLALLVEQSSLVVLFIDVFYSYVPMAADLEGWLVR